MDRLSQSPVDSAVCLTQASSILSQENSQTTCPLNEQELFNTLLHEIEGLKIESLEVWEKFNASNVPEPATNDSGVQYVDVLSGKKDFINLLTQELNSTDAMGNLRGKLDTYREFCAFLKNHLDQGREIEESLIEEIKRLTAKNDELDKRIKILSNILEQPEEESAETRRLSEQFNQTRDDMNYVLNNLHPKETAEEFSTVMLQLSQAQMENRDDKEAQYVEISEGSWHNNVLRCLMQSYLIVRHPRNPKLVRLLSDD